MPRKSKKINIAKIAAEAGVSIASVSRAINGRAGVSESVRKKIDLLLVKYDFKPEGSPQRGKRIALLVGNNNFTNYTGEVFRGIFNYTSKIGLSTTIIFKDKNTQEALLKQIRDQQCSGVIVIIPAYFSGEFTALGDSELPVVLVDEAIQYPGISFVDNDSYSGSREAVRHLLDLGHRKIAYVKCAHSTLNHIQRFKAYENTMKEVGIDINQDWVVCGNEKCSTYENAYRQTKKLLRKIPEITAMMTANDELAMGAMRAILESNKKIPDDISIIGFDNYQNTAFFHPPLTTVIHPMEQAGSIAAQYIDSYLKNPGDRKPIREILPTKLLVRESTKALKIRGKLIKSLRLFVFINAFLFLHLFFQLTDYLLSYQFA